MEGDTEIRFTICPLIVTFFGSTIGLGEVGGWRQRGSKRGERKKLGVQAKRERSTLKQRLSWQAASAGGRGLSETPLGKGFLKFHSLGLRVQKLSP